MEGKQSGLGVLAAIVAGLVGLAIVAVIVGAQAQTSSVLQAGGTALAGVIKAAVAPASGGNTVGGIGAS